MGIGAELVSLSEWAINRTLDRLAGMSDDELRWQPAPGSWTVRRLRDGRAVVDNRYGPGPDVPPPSIAWRLAHLIDVFGSDRNGRWLRAPAGVVDRAAPAEPWSISDRAAEALDLLRAGADYWLDVLRAVPEDDWFTALGPGCEPWHESTLVAFAHHQLDEAIHHAAELALLRDLYPYRVDRVDDEDPPITDVEEAAALGRWDLVETLVVGGKKPATTGLTALHQAAAVGDLAIVKLLVDAGASTEAVDPTFHITALGWAEYFDRPSVAAYLREQR